MTCTEDTAIYRVCVAYANSDSRRNKTYGSPLVIVPDTYSYNSSVVTIVFVSLYIPTQKYMPACFWYLTYSSIEVVAQQWRQQCAVRSMAVVSTYRLL